MIIRVQPAASENALIAALARRSELMEVVDGGGVPMGWGDEIKDTEADIAAIIAVYADDQEVKS